MSSFGTASHHPSLRRVSLFGGSKTCVPVVLCSISGQHHCILCRDFHSNLGPIWSVIGYFPAQWRHNSARLLRTWEQNIVTGKFVIHNTQPRIILIKGLNKPRLICAKFEIYFQVGWLGEWLNILLIFSPLELGLRLSLAMNLLGQAQAHLELINRLITS